MVKGKASSRMLPMSGDFRAEEVCSASFNQVFKITAVERSHILDMMAKNNP